MIPLILMCMWGTDGGRERRARLEHQMCSCSCATHLDEVCEGVGGDAEPLW
jgi:hypothetical protein